uniref:Cytochrome b5 heme-binding domain-containing protein n=1 Tax=Kalanchoe fedtschenkoi TaxID=63787 RepID=A0A7N0U6T7_KALFE
MFQVYDVTEFMDDHPGGGETLLYSAAKDATEEFDDAGHSDAAKELMKKYYMGDIDESTLPKTTRYYVAPQATQRSWGASGGGDFTTKIIKFLVPLVILSLALAISARSYAPRW